MVFNCRFMLHSSGLFVTLLLIIVSANSVMKAGLSILIKDTLSGIKYCTVRRCTRLPNWLME